MELVDGEPITRFAQRNNLSPRERARLLELVCDAVHHAHTQGRDSPRSQAGQRVRRRGSRNHGEWNESGVERGTVVKVLDFGVARATDGEVHITTVRHRRRTTRGHGALHGVPSSSAGDTSRLDARSDVYALGVLMFELLGGRLPHEVRGLSVPDAALRIREEDPDLISSVDTTLRGDLDTICAKALEKEPARRYGSAIELADDLRRFLANEPIRARPASTLYQIGRFCRRNRIAVGAAGIIALLVVVALVGLSWTTLRATRAEAAAVQRFEEAEAIAGFYGDVIRTVSSVGVGPDVRVIDMLDQMAERLESNDDARLAQYPLVKARIEHLLGTVYRDLGHYPRAQKFFRLAWEQRKQLLGDDHHDAVDSAFELGMSLTCLVPRSKRSSC